jgi:hypothetical protein
MAFVGCLFLVSLMYNMVTAIHHAKKVAERRKKLAGMRSTLCVVHVRILSRGPTSRIFFVRWSGTASVLAFCAQYNFCEYDYNVVLAPESHTHAAERTLDHVLIFIFRQDCGPSEGKPICALPHKQWHPAHAGGPWLAYIIPPRMDLALGVAENYTICVQRIFGIPVLVSSR